MRFKYHSYLNQLPNCPPSSYESKELIAFRFVFEEGHPKQDNNFLPVLIITPERRLGSDTEKCDGYGLSFFDTLENAKRRYITLEKSRPKIYKTLGTHIAEGLIEKNDGVVSKVSRTGHFTLHEFENADLKNKFQVVMRIYDDGRN